MKKIYFDNGSTSFPKAPGVAERVADILAHGSYNINRGGYEASYSLSDGTRIATSKFPYSDGTRSKRSLP